MSTLRQKIDDPNQHTWDREARGLSVFLSLVNLIFFNPMLGRKVASTQFLYLGQI